MNDILKTLFWENPDLPDKIYDFCKTIPEYQQAERDYENMLKKLTALVGYEQACEVEAILGRYMSQEDYAHYLFGLGLRQEVLSGMIDSL